ncbi:hypothetical protein [Kitasatospora aureofaciens]
MVRSGTVAPRTPRRGDGHPDHVLAPGADLPDLPSRLRQER